MYRRKLKIKGADEGYIEEKLRDTEENIKYIQRRKERYKAAKEEYTEKRQIKGADENYGRRIERYRVKEKYRSENEILREIQKT